MILDPMPVNGNLPLDHDRFGPDQSEA